ncbi:hypothetical protein QNA29_00060 [Rhodococcus opacus]|nr:hypothetical protein [Rhodococcus opacus]MDJ0412828.1 hypothetical protein [Rhodococcus opacus]
MLRGLAVLRWLDDGESMILYSPVGVGKPMWRKHADPPSNKRMREYTRPLELIIDDFVIREHTTTQSDDLCDLVSDWAVGRQTSDSDRQPCAQKVAPAVP